jgi:hypothetical protein
LELVCTAGIKEDGSWVRIYPVPYRSLDGDKQFRKYAIIEAPIIKHQSDSRKESYRVENFEEMSIITTLGANENWQERKDYIFKTTIYQNTQELIKRHDDDGVTLATFKPMKILSVSAESNGQEEKWTQEEIKQYKNANASLFADDELKNMPKIPYNFKIKFQDNVGKESSMSILDWEISQLYLNCKKSGSKELAKQKTIEKIEALCKKDVYVFLGTTKQYDKLAPNQFTIVGLFYPPKVSSYTPPLF